MLELLFVVLVLVGTFAAGSWIQNRHFQDLRIRESRINHIPVLSIKQLPSERSVLASGVVFGQVVMSLDYFRRMLASLRSLIGGPVKSYQPVLERARREAMLRMVESAQIQGFDAVLGVRLQTTHLGFGPNDEDSMGIEILVVGTAIKFDADYSS